MSYGLKKSPLLRDPMILHNKAYSPLLQYPIILLNKAYSPLLQDDSQLLAELSAALDVPTELVKPIVALSDRKTKPRHI